MMSLPVWSHVPSGGGGYDARGPRGDGREGGEYTLPSSI